MSDDATTYHDAICRALSLIRELIAMDVATLATLHLDGAQATVSKGRS